MTVLFCSVALHAGSVEARGGREPCDRGAGGISHCERGKFVCNSGIVSKSKQTCSDVSPVDRRSESTGKAKKSKQK